MSSQRMREQRIAERLQAGALPLATPSDTVQPAPSGDAPCQGCHRRRSPPTTWGALRFLIVRATEPPPDHTFGAAE
jgi:hypothetical protein